MRQLRENSTLNAPAEYERIFKERRKEGYQHMDVRRWEELLKPWRGGTLIDIGCLDSLVPHWAMQRYPAAEVWGLDRIDMAPLREMFPEVNYVNGDAYHTDFPDNFFDYVVAGELIEHIERPKDFIKEVFRILKPSGTFALSTPREEEKGGVDQHRHLWSFSQQDIRDLCKPYMKGMKYKVIPSWIERRREYVHPYLIAWITKSDK